MIVAPGGGFVNLADYEGAPIAEWLNSLGISAFVLMYRRKPSYHPIPFLNAQRALRYVRYNASRFNIQSNHLGMIGFSAGGYLTSCLATLADKNWFPPEYIPDSIDTIDAHPTVVVLCYALISLVDYAHKEANANLLGKNPDPGLLEIISTDRQVSATTSPAFIWTTKADKMLSYRHSELFAEACEQFGVDHELLEFETGDHGLGLTRISSRSF